MAEVDARNNPRGAEAARRVMLELWSILGEYADAMTLVGGSAPPLLVGDVPDDPYVGTLDVDLVLDPLAVPDETYRSIAQQLRGRGYEQGPQPFQWVRTVPIDGEEIEVEVDLLAPATTRTGRNHRHERIEGAPLPRRTDGAELVRDSFVESVVEGRLPDGRPNRVRLRVASAAVIVVLKALAMRTRDKPKDAYDIDYLLAYQPGGVDAVASDIQALGDSLPVSNALDILAERFDSVGSYGPASVAAYRRLAAGSPEADGAQALAFARVQELLRILADKHS